MNQLIRWVAEYPNPVRRTVYGADCVPGWETVTGGLAGAVVCENVRDAAHLAELIGLVEHGGILAIRMADAVDAIQDAGLRIVDKRRPNKWLCRR